MTEGELRFASQQAEQIAALVLAAHDAIIRTTLDQVVETWNSSATQLFGYSAAEAVGRRLDTLLAPTNVNGSSANTIAAIYAGRKPELQYLRLRHKTGLLIPVSLEASPVLDSAGNAVAVTILCRDKSQPTGPEPWLQNSQEHYRSIIEGTLHGIVVQQEGKIVYANRAMADLFGYDSAQAMHGLDTFDDLVAEADRQRLRARTAAVYGGAQVQPHPGWRGHRPDGKQIWVSSTAQLSQWQGRPAVTSFYIDITKEKLAERRQHNSETKLQIAVAMAGMGLGEMNYRSGTITLDATAAALFDLPANSPVPRADICGRFHPGDAPAVLAKMADALDPTGSGFMTAELRIVRPDGTTRWLSMRKQIEFAAPQGGGPPYAATGLLALIDISEHAAAEEKTRISELRYRRLFEAAQDGVLLLDPTTCKITEANPFMSRLLGYPREQLVGKQMFEIGLLKDEDASREMFDKLKTTHQVRYEDLPLKSRNGLTREVEVVANLYDENGQPVIQCNIRDITERRLGELQLRLYEKVVLNTRDAVMITEAEPIDMPGPRILYVNPAFTDMTGYTALEAIGQTPRFLQGKKTGRDQLDKIRASLTMWQPVRVELVNYRKDGSEFDVELEIVPVADEKGWFTHWVSIQRDMSERKAAEERNKLIMFEMNHRAKNLLAVVQSVAQQTRRGDPATFVARLSERIQGLAASQDLLVQNQWQGVELTDLVKAQLAHFKDLIGTRVLIGGPPMRLTPAHAQGIGMALHELATNSGKYGALSNDAGRVHVTWQTNPLKAPAFSMSWLEEGGPIVAPPTHSGFGQMVTGRMVEAAVNGAVSTSYAEGGLAWTMTAPIVDTSARWRTQAPAIGAMV